MENKIKFPKINLANVKAVLMDLDNTLYHYNSCHELAIQECYASYNRDISPNISFAEFSNIYRKNRDLVTKRLSPQGVCRSRLFAFQAMFEEMNLGRNWELAKEYDDFYWNSLINHMVIAKDALSFVEECRSSGIDICIVSDMIANIQIRKLQKLGISQSVKYLVTSEEVGVEKPDPRIFQAALNKLDLGPKEVIMIGDCDNKDIKGGQNMGIESYKVMVEK
ncbi:MAG: HAD family hydrolase [Rickettsiaceae bacterium]|nr:HAD family hydrolase [Rickettsiaceae bacterium]